jgi:ubiquinone/menaquinone biosynthesis C-methylase UbiE
MLSEFFPGCHATGLDQNEELIETAVATKELHSNLKFLKGNALKLPFENNRFDFVFCRYLLHHLPDALVALEEMKRVAKAGGIIFVQEPDVNSFQSFPGSWAYPKFKEYISLLFADVIIGRKLISYFKALKLQNISHDVQAILSDQDSTLKEFYTLTAASLGKALLQKNILNEKDFNEWVIELERVEHDPDTIVLMHPTIAVWGVKS